MKTQSTTPRLAPASSILPFVRRFALTLLLAASLPATPALGSPAGELDPYFGDQGRILLREPRFADMYGVDIFPEPGTGKLLAVASDFDRNQVLLRFNSDGSLDQSVGDQGSMPLDFGDDRLNILDIERLADGKLLVAGAMNVYGSPDNVLHGAGLLARMHEDGTPDDSFGDNGRTMLQLGGTYESFSEILLQADGGIVVFGSTDRTGRVERILARYTKDGVLDTGFGSAASAGISVVDVEDTTTQLITLVPQFDGRFMACGSTSSSAQTLSTRKILAVRLLSNGSRDAAFGANGRALIGDELNGLEVRDCLALADGHLAIAGTLGSGEQQRATVFRVTPDGRLDAGFGLNGMVQLPTETRSAAQTILLLSDGSLAVAGYQLGQELNGWVPWADMLIARIDPTTGAIDHGFGNRGMTAVDFGARGYRRFAVPASLMQQPDGKLVAIGSQFNPGDWWDYPSIAITRVDPYGSGSNGWAGLTESYASTRNNGGEVALRVRRTGGSTGSLSVDYRTLDDTAVAGADFVASSGTLTWPGGDMSDRILMMTVLNNPAAANARFFNVELSNSSGGLAMDLATVAILRNAPPVVTPPPSGGGNNGGNSGAGGGGATGIELLFLLALLAFGSCAIPAGRPGKSG